MIKSIELGCLELLGKKGVLATLAYIETMEIDALTAELYRTLGVLTKRENDENSDPQAKKAAEIAATQAEGTKKKRKLSEEGRARIAEAQRKRWSADKRAEEGNKETPKQRKRYFNKKMRANMARAQRERRKRERGE